MQSPDKPLVSVVIRSMDRPSLKRALDSVAAQDYPSIEVIVVGACGPLHRDLPQTCGAFPLNLRRSDRPLPRAEAANAGLDAARGDWINLLDDDDVFLPDHVSSLMSILRGNPGAQLAYARSLSIERNGQQSEFGSPFKFWRQLDTGFFHSQAAMFARSLLDQGARFDPTFIILEDMDFFVQCAQLTRFVHLEKVTSMSYRDEGTSGTGTSRDEHAVNLAISQLRSKWSALEQRLRATPEFRLEQAQWCMANGRTAEAKKLLEALHLK